MEIREIADGTITVEMQPDEAMDLAIACRVAEAAAYSGNPLIESGPPGAAEKRYVLYRSLFEALAVARNAQYSISARDEMKAAALTAMRGVKR